MITISIYHCQKKSAYTIELVRAAPGEKDEALNSKGGRRSEREEGSKDMGLHVKGEERRGRKFGNNFLPLDKCNSWIQLGD